MAVNINPPSIKGANADVKIDELHRYLYQLVEQLNFELNTMSREINELQKNK